MDYGYRADKEAIQWQGEEEEVEEELYFKVRLRGGKEERVYESGLKGSLRK